MAVESGALPRADVVAPRKRFFRIDNRFLPPLLITSILLTAHLSFGILEGWERTALAIVTAIGAELVMGRLTYGVWPHPASAYISGISAGILVRSPFYWPYFLTSLISITSKYVLRVRGRHLLLGRAADPGTVDLRRVTRERLRCPGLAATWRRTGRRMDRRPHGR